MIDMALLEAASLDEEQIQLVRDLQMHSVMVVPLAARGRTLGAITFVWANRSASTPADASSWPRSSAAAPGSHSTTRATVAREHAARGDRSSARCCCPPGLARI